MSNANIKCPVCSTTVENAIEFCLVCNWEMLSIPESASKWLRDYYTQKYKFHFDQYQKFKELNKINIEQSQNIEQLTSKVREADRAIEDGKKTKLQLENCIKENEELNDQLKTYQNKYGDSWIANAKEIKPIIVIKWEMLSSFRIRFYLDDIICIFPEEIIILLKMNLRPTADGDFEFAKMIKTSNRKIIDDRTFEINITLNELKNGKYFFRFKNLNFNTNNIIFFHKDQAAHNSFDWEKTTLKVQL